MSLAGELKDISSKPNESKYALYESVATRVVTAQDSPAIVQIVKHCQSTTQPSPRRDATSRSCRHARDARHAEGAEESELEHAHVQKRRPATQHRFPLLFSLSGWLVAWIVHLSLQWCRWKEPSSTGAPTSFPICSHTSCTCWQIRRERMRCVESRTMQSETRRSVAIGRSWLASGAQHVTRLDRCSSLTLCDLRGVGFLFLVARITLPACRLPPLRSPGSHGRGRPDAAHEAAG